MPETLSYEEDFDQAVTASFDRVVAAIEQGRSPDEDPSGGGGCLFLKNPSGVVLHANDDYRRFFGGGEAVVGRHPTSFLDPSISDVALATDSLILDGVDTLRFEHLGRGPDGEAYMLDSYKRTLRPLGKNGWATFGFSRPVARVAGRKIEERFDMARRHRAYLDLHEQDRWLCHQIAMGASSSSIGDELGVGRRAVESRKSRVYRKLGVTKAVELARLLVHFQHRGFIDLGL